MGLGAHHHDTLSVLAKKLHQQEVAQVVDAERLFNAVDSEALGPLVELLGGSAHRHKTRKVDEPGFYDGRWRHCSLDLRDCFIDALLVALRKDHMHVVLLGECKAVLEAESSVAAVDEGDLLGHGG